MPDPDPKDDPPEKKRFLIQRKRLGAIRKIDLNGEFGFIDAEDFRDDVFFHRTVWLINDQVERNTGKLSEELVEQFVEFELDDQVFSEDKRLRAKVVRPTRRPEGRKMSGRDATFKIVTHHPNAKRKKPNWRK